VRDHIATVDFNIDYGVSFFETTIRYLGTVLCCVVLCCCCVVCVCVCVCV